MEGLEVTPYFERRVMNNPERAHLVLYVAETVRAPDETLVQSDGKIRPWRYVPELRYHIRVTTTADGALFNAHEDSKLHPQEGQAGVKFDYYPDTDSLYIELNPGRERKPGATQVVVGWGDHDIVIDVDGEGMPVGIDIHSFASRIVDLTKLEAEGPIFGLVRQGDSDRRVS